MEDGNIATTKAPTTNNSKESSKGSKKATSSDQRLQEQQQALKCPRCDSMNTKFCYYNNYCLSQPRHFCKTCRRYWTKGGSTRNVPVGGGCRKSKKLKQSSLNSSRDSSTTSFDIGRFKFFHGVCSSPSPTIDFQLGGLTTPRLNVSSSPSSGVVYNQVSHSFGDIEGSSLPTYNTCLNLDPSLGFNLSLPPLFKQQQSVHENNFLYDGVGDRDEIFVGDQVAASIESLSSINQDLHWKLQQQRFAAMMFGGNEDNVSQGVHPPSIEYHQEIQRPKSILFQNLELLPRESGESCGNYSSKEGQSDNLATEYFINDTNAPTMNSTRSTTSNGANDGYNENVSWNNGGQAWNNQDQFGALP